MASLDAQVVFAAADRGSCARAPGRWRTRLRTGTSPTSVRRALDGARLGRYRHLRKFQLVAATHAHGVVQLQHLVAARTLPSQLLVLIAVQHRRQQPDERDAEGDQEPERERAALDAADKASG